jgi:hypothetical protein
MNTIDELVIFISIKEGDRLIYLPMHKHHLTKKALMSLPKKYKSPSVAWGGWVHAFYCIHSALYDFDGHNTIVLKRYDAVND